MSEIKIIFKDLEDTSNYVRKVAKKCDEYCEELDKDFTDKWSELPESPLQDNTDRIYGDCGANYYIVEKKKALKEKKNLYSNFADKVDTFKDNTENAEKKIVKTINDSRESFLKEHENLKGDGWAAFFANIVVDVPVLGWLVEKASNIIDGIHDLRVSLRYWYEVCGGKEIVDTALAITGVVLAAVGLVVAAVGLTLTGPIWGIIVSVCALVGAVIAMGNAIVNLYQQINANKQEDPAWAQYYGGINSMSDVLRKKTFDSKFSNKWSGRLATTIDVVETICAVVAVVDGINKLYNSSGLQKLFGDSQAGQTYKVRDKEGNIIDKAVNGNGGHKYKFNFEKFKNCVTSSDGRKQIGDTVKKNWKNIVFGYNKNERGFKVYKKQYTRAFAKEGVDGKTKAISKLFKRDFGRVNSAIKMTESVGKIAAYGFSFDRVNEVAKNVYSVGNYGGAVKSVNSVAENTKKIPKTVKGISSYNSNIKNAFKTTA